MPKNGNGNGNGNNVNITVVIDTITGSGDNDFITGSNGADLIDGRAGSDLIVGRRGDDILIGGNGPAEERFGFTVGDGHDVIRDFNASSDDLLFSYGTADTGSATNLTNGWHITTDEGHTLTATQQGADTLLTWDAGGDTVLLQNVAVTDISTDDLHFSASSTGWMF
jgi:Ca2+-binding RTX toxin-like protein